ncbi:hypothetical protein ACFOD9_12860 [Novosphingobium bradum]|uniref:Uncharacterized protein n=1 Tax=Novosphingobium bradum TaxID=1737444 RepID=A0ABV7IR40_9SPHN
MGFDFPDGPQGLVPPGETGALAGWWPGRDGVSGDGLAPGHPDWAGLRARFAALHAFRGSLDSVGGATIPAGGFRAAAEAVLASTRGDHGVVNRICSGNGKAGAGMIAALSPTVPREATEDTHD